MMRSGPQRLPMSKRSAGYYKRKPLMKVIIRTGGSMLRGAFLYLYTLRLCPVKTLNPYSELAMITPADNQIQPEHKRRLIRIMYAEQSPFVCCCILFRLSLHNLDHIFPLARTIKFAEINTLPTSEQQSAILNNNGLGRTCSN